MIIAKILNKISQICEKISTYLKVLFYERGQILQKYHDKILIVGNGPSAGEIDLNYYKNQGYAIMVVNFFATKSKDFLSLKPEYYCCIDPAFYSKDNNQCEVNNAIDKTTWDINFICLESENPQFTNEKINIIKLNIREFFGEINEIVYKSLKMNKINCGMQNVLCAALYYSISAKFSEILLVGFEQDWHRELYVDKNNNVIRKCKHFYSEEEINVIKTGQINYGELYKYFYWYYLTLMEIQHYSIYAKKAGVQIYNLCENSYIDVFEKKEIVKKN